MPTMQQVALLLLAVFAVADAHPEPVNSEEGCTCEPGAKAFGSYHIHVLFYPDLAHNEFSNNTHGSKFARSVRKAFIEHFNVPQCDNDDPFGNPGKLCTFPVDATGTGGEINTAPFVAPNFAIFVPVDRYADVVPWMMANRGDLDFLVHPNSCGFKCAEQDHLLWSVWGGNKWPVRFELPATARSQEGRLKGHTEVEDNHGKGSMLV